MVALEVLTQLELCQKAYRGGGSDCAATPWSDGKMCVRIGSSAAGRCVFDLSESGPPPACLEGPGPLKKKQKQMAVTAVTVVTSVTAVTFAVTADFFLTDPSKLRFPTVFRLMSRSIVVLLDPILWIFTLDQLC